MEVIRFLAGWDDTTAEMQRGCLCLHIYSLISIRRLSRSSDVSWTRSTSSAICFYDFKEPVAGDRDEGKQQANAWKPFKIEDIDWRSVL